MTSPDTAAAVVAGYREPIPRPRRRRGSPRRGRVAAAVFLAPALLLLGALVVYPVIYSMWRSLFSAGGGDFVGLGNYATIFTDPATFVAIRNNVLWVVVVPISCTLIGLIFAVLMGRIRWGLAFKLIVFMPMAVSMVAAGVIFRTTFQENPQLGAANAALVAINERFAPSTSYPGARPRPDLGLEAADGVIRSAAPVALGGQADFPLTGITEAQLPGGSKAAVASPPAGTDAIAGTVWLDFVAGGGGVIGQLGEGKPGLSGITLEAVGPDGAVADTAITDREGRYAITGLDPGEYRVQISAADLSASFAGASWLGPSLVTAVIMMSYIWIWAGFAMVMIGSGLAALDRSLPEAARMDGATEWQVFSRITVPLLAPVLAVVVVTLIVYVLKIFDLVYVIPPTASLPSATVIAVEMWSVSFGGGNNQGLGSALSVLLLVLVLPAMMLNLRRLRQEGRER